MNKFSVLLRIYKGRKLSYNVDGSPQNENQIVTLTNDTLEWHNYLNLIRVNDICKANVEDVLDINGKEIQDADEKAKLIAQFNAEVAAKFEQPEVKQTPEQLRIAELERKIEVLTSGAKSPAKDDATTKPKPSKPTE